MLLQARHDGPISRGFLSGTRLAFHAGVSVRSLPNCALLWLGLLLAGALLPDRAQARGSHFLLEVGAGATLSGDGGVAVSADLGAGGKFRAFPPRFYWIAHFGLSHYEEERLSALPPQHEEGSFYDLATGPRVYVPLSGELRWLGEALLGASRVEGRYSQPDLGPLSAERWLLLGLLSTGLQLRVLQQLSVGVRITLALDQGTLPGVHRLAGASSPARTSLTTGLTWHF